MKKNRFNGITGTELKAIFFLMSIIILGGILNFFDYMPPQLRNQEDISAYQTGLNILLAEDFIPRIDLNKSSFEELQYVRGIGEALARSIIEYRDNVGFRKVDDLLNIRGIGNARLEEFRKIFFVEGDTLHVSFEMNDNTASETQATPPQTIAPSRLININTATQEELMTLRGIGQKRASDIIEYRTLNGRFYTIDEIKNVHGIGNQTFENIKNFISIGN